MDSIIRWILDSSLNSWITGTHWAWPAFEILHFVGLSLLLGSMLIIDLRLVGYLRRMSISAVYAYLPLAAIGFGINLVTGALFVFGDPERYMMNISFQFKMLLVLIAGANALWFACKISPAMSFWSPDGDSSPQAKIIACVSLLSWFGVLLLGRLIPYVGTG